MLVSAFRATHSALEPLLGTARPRGSPASTARPPNPCSHERPVYFPPVPTVPALEASMQGRDRKRPILLWRFGTVESSRPTCEHGLGRGCRIIGGFIVVCIKAKAAPSPGARRLTRRCSGLATLAAELHFVRRRPERERQAPRACPSPPFAHCTSYLKRVTPRPRCSWHRPRTFNRSIARASRLSPFSAKPFLLLALSCKGERRRDQFLLWRFGNVESFRPPCEHGLGQGCRIIGMLITGRA